MLRQLLTLLAVISGFTLAAAPVSAADAQSVSVAAAQAGQDCQTVVNLPLQLSAPALNQRAVEPRPCPRPILIVVTPTVQLQADRARE